MMGHSLNEHDTSVYVLLFCKTCMNAWDTDLKEAMKSHSADSSHTV